MDRHTSTVRLSKSFKAFDGRGLSGPIWTDHAEDFALINSKSDSVYRAQISIAFH